MKSFISSLVLAFIVAVYAEDEQVSAPSYCPLGHATLTWQKVDYLCVTGPEKVLECSTCGFAFDPWLTRWFGRARVQQVVGGRLPDFSSLILGIPVPEDDKEKEGVWYSQARIAAEPLRDSCLYWTSANFDATIDRIRAYLTSREVHPVEAMRQYGDRYYSYFFARVGERFLKVEVMRESNAQVVVDARLVAVSEIEHDYLLKEALRIQTAQPGATDNPGDAQ